MIFLTLIVLAGSMYILYYIRNRQEERLFNRRDRLQEKQEELFESLRAKKEGKEKLEDQEGLEDQDSPEDHKSNEDHKYNEGQEG